jgi:hypothetical protein
MTQPFPPDDEILSLFREWIVAQTEADALGYPSLDHPQRGEFDAAHERIEQLAWSIADVPSRGPIGLAIKAYLRHHADQHPCGRRPESLGELRVDCSEAALEQSIIRDAVRFVPELGPLAAAALESAEKEAA